MKKFRENAAILHNAAAKRKIAANLVKKESSSQLRIFNTLFTAQESFENEEAAENEVIQKRREKEKILENVIQARIEQREAEEKKERENATTTTKEDYDKIIRDKSDKNEKDLFGK
uniref:Uncharacterized protein n=1 Tax=Panagrolaimus superbus TaxID=310955 RepID=A0A914XW84_9BILA